MCVSHIASHPLLPHGLELTSMGFSKQAYWSGLLLIQLSVITCTAAYQDPLSVGFSRQKY